MLKNKLTSTLFFFFIWKPSSSGCIKICQKKTTNSVSELKRRIYVDIFFLYWCGNYENMVTVVVVVVVVVARKIRVAVICWCCYCLYCVVTGFFAWTIIKTHFLPIYVCLRVCDVYGVEATARLNFYSCALSRSAIAADNNDL
jgi:hypothetical protein